MTFISKILLSVIIFFTGVFLIMIINNDNSNSAVFFIIFPSSIVGIVAIWKYKPKKYNFKYTHHNSEYDLFNGFIDYFQLLQLNIDFTDQQLKTAYKREAIKWHPDKNPGINTTIKMQEINEANLILSDYYSRERYKQEYYRYLDFCRRSKNQNKEDIHYEVLDKTLKSWMFNARQKAEELAKQSLKEITDMSVISGKLMFRAFIRRALYYLAFLFICFIFTLFFKACN